MQVNPSEHPCSGWRGEDLSDLGLPEKPFTEASPVSAYVISTRRGEQLGPADWSFPCAKLAYLIRKTQPWADRLASHLC